MLDKLQLTNTEHPRNRNVFFLRKKETIISSSWYTVNHQIGHTHVFTASNRGLHHQQREQQTYPLFFGA
jgi:hypothetical protein